MVRLLRFLVPRVVPHVLTHTFVHNQVDGAGVHKQAEEFDNRQFGLCRFGLCQRHRQPHDQLAHRVLILQLKYFLLSTQCQQFFKKKMKLVKRNRRQVHFVLLVNGFSIVHRKALGNNFRVSLVLEIDKNDFDEDHPAVEIRKNHRGTVFVHDEIQGLVNRHGRTKFDEEALRTRLQVSAEQETLDHIDFFRIHGRRALLGN